MTLEDLDEPEMLFKEIIKERRLKVSPPTPPEYLNSNDSPLEDSGYERYIEFLKLNKGGPSISELEFYDDDRPTIFRNDYKIGLADSPTVADPGPIEYFASVTVTIAQ